MEIRGLTKLAQKEICEVLERFGLGASEREVYVALLGGKRMTVTPLARLVDMPVTTVQSIVNRLVERGLVHVTVRKSRHVYEADDPSVLRRLLEREIEQVASIIPLLKKIHSGSEVSPKIKVYYRDRISDIFHQALKTKNKLIYEIVAAKEFQEVIGERLHFTKLRLQHGVRLKSLRVESREIKKYSVAAHIRELREAKFLPREINFRCSITFWDDTVAFITPSDEGLAWMVESKSFRETIQQLFDLLWSVSRRMETKQE